MLLNDCFLCYLIFVFCAVFCCVFLVVFLVVFFFDQVVCVVYFYVSYARQHRHRWQHRQVIPNDWCLSPAKTFCYTVEHTNHQVKVATKFISSILFCCNLAYFDSYGVLVPWIITTTFAGDRCGCTKPPTRPST